MKHEWFITATTSAIAMTTSPIVYPDGTPAPPIGGQTYAGRRRDPVRVRRMS